MWVTISDLMKLPSFPNSPQGCRKALHKFVSENPQIKRKKEGTKREFEYNSALFPERIQLEINKIAQKQIINMPRADLSIARENLNVTDLTDQQIAIADARMLLVAYVTELERTTTRYKAVAQVVEMAKSGELPEHLMQIIDVANAKKGENRTVSHRSLMGWVVEYHKCSTVTERLKALSPLSLGRKKLDIFSVEWLPDFLSVYQDPNRPSVSSCIRSLRNFSRHQLPSDTAINRVLNRLPVPVRERGRTTGTAYKQFKPYTARDWSVLNVNEVWIGDGHGFKAKVKHPLNGRPFQPEVTAIIDGKTRYIVGWSVHMSESCLAVADAIRHGISRCGLPNIYYSDNGGGEKNKNLDADLTGILPRLGIHHETGLPGNPQGRGIIERFWQTTTIPLARSYESFIGSSLDNDTRRIRAKELDSAVNALMKNSELSKKQHRAINRLPHFDDFLADLQCVFDEYNVTPHSALPVDPKTGERFSPFSYREMLLATTAHNTEYLTDVELALLFRPQEIRKVSRGIVELFNNKYFHVELSSYHGEQVRVCYDIHDPHSVIVKTMNGSIICNAIWDGNKVDAFPVSVREIGEKKRLKAQIKRKENKIEEFKSFVNPIRTIEHQMPDDLITSSAQRLVIDDKPIFTSEAEKALYYRKHHKIAVGE
ncbi:transposase [Mergibacter septicus]|uniref:transposase family protein n=1 Tax=Mergibacter septicus TaxID=221402 RepID=UPI0011790CF5|nr:transposase family protein [Mergibacter septicus]AWX14241.1 transposase [Mergibacter septicus]